MRPTPSPIGMKQEYGCVACEAYHLEGEALYAEHWEFLRDEGPRLIREWEWAVRRLRNFQQSGASKDDEDLSAPLV